MSLKNGKNSSRPPVVTIMGHVDHGKTSLLDAISKTNIQAGETGGITQHIGAYQVDFQGKSITFIDTPGHEAFTAMRARGGSVADLVVLVVAANDGVQPQTREAIGHAKAAGVPVVVAINKIDLPTADARRVKAQLAEEDVLVEDLGGKVVAVEVSATAKTNLEKLLEIIILVSEMEELKGDASKVAQGVVIESRLDPKRGPVATIIVRDGSLHLGDTLIVGASEGKVKSLINYQGKRVETAGPSVPVEVVGLDTVPQVGDRLGKDIVEEVKASPLSETPEGVRTLRVVIKADVAGTLEAIQASLAKLETPESAVKIIYAGVGAITDSDILLAKAGRGMVVGFNVSSSPEVASFAQDSGVEIWTYTTIYDLLDEATLALAGLLEMEKLQAPGKAEVLKLFPLPSGDVVIGCVLVQGVFKIRNLVEVVRDNEVISESHIKNIKIGKEKVKKVEMGDECGLLLVPKVEVRVGDIIRITPPTQG